ncbi:PREDICTED: small integral membrane protein 1 isoform X1 [Chinchilla lanigera]|uniref:small integral membrane protein 1 isoform X1 n=1 Tax=Chinchilla lanigera TaxID=34839 RepID=UPI00069629C7|nr:PREDICTED: small integral membrane protein 1 isoform X1 [Chinchilla lanigera]
MSTGRRVLAPHLWRILYSRSRELRGGQDQAPGWEEVIPAPRGGQQSVRASSSPALGAGEGRGALQSGWLPIPPHCNFGRRLRTPAWGQGRACPALPRPHPCTTKPRPPSRAQAPSHLSRPRPQQRLGPTRAHLGPGPAPNAPAPPLPARRRRGGARCLWGAQARGTTSRRTQHSTADPARRTTVC